MASLEGFEPTTRCLEGSCSVQLSYRDEQFTLKIYHDMKSQVKIRFYFSGILAGVFYMSVNVEAN